MLVLVIVENWEVKCGFVLYGTVLIAEFEILNWRVSPTHAHMDLTLP
jgi:hypothetical protein